LLGRVLGAARACYAAPAYQTQVPPAGRVVTMSRAGDLIDNPPAERFFASCKREPVDCHIWLLRQPARRATVEWNAVVSNRSPGPGELQDRDGRAEGGDLSRALTALIRRVATGFETARNVRSDGRFSITAGG